MRAVDALRGLARLAGRSADRLLVGGLVGVAAHNVWLWRRDRIVAERLRADLANGRPALRTTPRVSMLVAAWNEVDFIERHIRSALDLGYPGLEYILCAGGEDGTFELARRYAGPGVVILEQLPGEGKQAALRKAFAHATGEIDYLTDADCVLDDDSFARLLAPIVNDGWAAASGMSRPLDEQLGSSLCRYQYYRDVYWLMRRGARGNDIFGRNAAIRADVLTQLGAFQQPVATGTDYHLSGLFRAHDIPVVYSRSLVRSRVPESVPEYVQMWQRWIRNLLVQGPGSQRLDEATRAAIAGVLGGFTWSGPGWWLVGGLGLRLWVLLSWWGWVQRLRQTGVAAWVAGRTEAWTFGASVMLFQLADAAAAATAPAQLPRRAWRARW
jgi:hypothetical protein